MYQNKIEQEAKEAAASVKLKEKHSNVFARSVLLPMSFEPDEDVCDATHIARDILIKRSDSEIIELSKAVTSMMRVGENLLQSLSMKLLDTSSTRKSVVLTEGRSLYLLCDYFDLSGIEIESLQWAELFATLTLMQSAEILHAPLEIENYDEPLRGYFKQTVQGTIAQLKEEIIDSVARAECLFDKNNKNAKSGSAGGHAKAKHMEPLKVEVNKRYLKHYTEYSARKAGMIIEAELEAEKSELLLLSEAEEKNHQFSKWIGDFKNGKWKMPI